MGYLELSGVYVNIKSMVLIAESVIDFIVSVWVIKDHEMWTRSIGSTLELCKKKQLCNGLMHSKLAFFSRKC